MSDPQSVDNPEHSTGPLKPRERLNLVYQRLREMPAPSNADQALGQLNSTLDAVEDEHSGVQKNPNPGLEFDGRMYPPQEDFIARQEDGGLVARTKGHTITCSPKGDMTIANRRTNEVEFERAGAQTEAESSPSPSRTASLAFPTTTPAAVQQSGADQAVPTQPTGSHLAKRDIQRGQGR